MTQVRPETKEKRKGKGIRMMILTLTLLALGAVPLAAMQRQPAASAESMPVQPVRKGRIVMYLMDAPGIRLRDEDAQRLDQLNYSFALIRDGEASGSHWTGISRVEAFLRRHPHIQGVLSVGGWGADGFSDACMTEEGRRKLADSILRLVDAHGFTGVDLDWEYPGVSGTGIVSRPEDPENWLALLALLREGLDEREAQHGREYVLSVALGAGEHHLNAIDAQRLSGIVDQAVVMAYDLCGFDRMTGHHAGLYPGAGRKNTGAYAVEQLIAAGMKPDQLLLGIPAYGRVWRQASSGAVGSRAATSGNRTISFDDVLRLQDKGYTMTYDETAQAAAWYDGSSFVSAESDRSIGYKCVWLREQGLQGAAVWAYGQDGSGAMLAMLDAALRE